MELKYVLFVMLWFGISLLIVCDSWSALKAYGVRRKRDKLLIAAMVVFWPIPVMWVLGQGVWAIMTYKGD